MIYLTEDEIRWLNAVAITHIDLLKKQIYREKLKDHEGYNSLKSASKKLIEASHTVTDHQAQQSQ